MNFSRITEQRLRNAAVGGFDLCRDKGKDNRGLRALAKKSGATGFIIVTFLSESHAERCWPELEKAFKRQRQSSGKA